MHTSSLRVLVTGAAGFAGRHTLAALAASGVGAICGIGHGTPAILPVGASYHAADLDDRERLRELVGLFKPTHVLHLAAYSSVSQAAVAAAKTWRTNVVGLLNLVEVVQDIVPSTTFIFVSSSEVYGRTFLSSDTVDECSLLQPAGNYGRTKRAGEELVADVFAGTSVRLIILRPFNHIGPGQDERFVVASFAMQIARIEADASPPTVDVGNLDSKREFLDVRDVARAYAKVVAASYKIDHGTILNIAGAPLRSISSVLDDLRTLSRAPFEVRVTDSRKRALEIPIARGCSKRLQRITDWRPEIPWGTTLSDTLDAARQAYIANSD